MAAAAAAAVSTGSAGGALTHTYTRTPAQEAKDRETRHAAALFERMRVGTSLIKLAASGTAVKKHVHVTPGNSHLKWDPSRRKVDADFVDIGSVKHLLPGASGARVAKYASGSEQASVRAFASSRTSVTSAEAMCGWMEKLGGAHGGRKVWVKRWCVLVGSKLSYFAGPSDVEEKGAMDVTGASVTAADDGVSFSLTWNEPGSAGAAASGETPSRELRADSPSARDRWIAAVKRAVRLERARAGKTRPESRLGAAMGGKAGTDRGLIVDEGLRARAREMSGIAAPDVTDTAFTIVTAEGADNGVAFLCPNMREYDLWYTAIMYAAAQRHSLSPDKRVAAYTAVLAEGSNDPSLRVLLGEQYEVKGMRAEALAEYQQAVEAAPLLASARKAYGRLLLHHARDAAEAIPHLEFASVLQDGEDFEALLWLAEARFAAREYLPAAAAYQLAAVLEPGNIAVHVGIADALQAAGDLPGADAAYAAALTLMRKAVAAGKPSENGIGKAQMDEHVLRKHEAVLTAVGKTADAAKLAKEAEEAETAHAPQHAQEAALLSCPGHWREAVRHWEIVLRARPADTATLLSAASAYFETEADRVAVAPAASARASEAPEAVAPRAASRQPSRKSAAEDQDAEPGEGGDEDDEYVGADPVHARSDGTDPSLDDVIGVTSSSTGPSRRASVAGPRPGVESSSSIASGGLPADLPVPSGAPPFGSLACDKLSVRELLAKAEELVVKILAIDAAHAGANILCARIFERLADVERSEVTAMIAAGGYTGADGVWQPIPADAVLEDQIAASGWSVNTRLQRVEAFLQYVSAAYSESKYATAPYLLGKLYKRQGKLDDALTHVKLALERDPALAVAHDLQQRILRLQAGKPEEDASARHASGSRRDSPEDLGSPSKAAPDVAFGHELDVTRVAAGSKDERDAAFFAAMKEKKRKEEEDRKKREEDKVRSMTAEERAQHEAAMRDREKHDARKERMLKGQLGAYSGGSARANLLGRARGGKSARGVDG